MLRMLKLQQSHWNVLLSHIENMTNKTPEKKKKRNCCIYTFSLYGGDIIQQNVNREHIDRQAQFIWNIEAKKINRTFKKHVNQTMGSGGWVGDSSSGKLRMTFYFETRAGNIADHFVSWMWGSTQDRISPLLRLVSVWKQHLVLTLPDFSFRHLLEVVRWTAPRNSWFIIRFQRTVNGHPKLLTVAHSAQSRHVRWANGKLIELTFFGLEQAQTLNSAPVLNRILFLDLWVYFERTSVYNISKWSPSTTVNRSRSRARRKRHHILLWRSSRSSQYTSRFLNSVLPVGKTVRPNGRRLKHQI